MGMTEMDETTPTATTEPRTAEPARTEARSAPARRVAPKRAPRRRGVVVSDPVGDMLTRVRNAVRARHDTVELPTSRMRAEIARILKAEGYAVSYTHLTLPTNREV